MFHLTHTQRFSRVADRFSNVLFRGVASTPAICASPSAVPVVYSLLDHRHVTAYLLAIKSFWRFLGDVRCAVAVQSDGSLTDADCELLRSHIDGLSIYSKEDCDKLLDSVVPSEVQRWLPPRDAMCFFLPLKLLNVLYRFSERYVLLFDSDLLFLRPPVEVVDCLASNSRRVFHTPGGNALTPDFRNMGCDLSRVDIAEFNAGFAGFWNHFTEDDIASVLRRVRQHNAALFSHWEIEQALWCVLLNYCHDPLSLGRLAPGYVGNGWRSYDELHSRAVLVHFVGSTRFRDLNYLRLGRQVIRELRRGSIEQDSYNRRSSVRFASSQRPEVT